MELGGMLNMPGKGPLPSVPRFVHLDREKRVLAYGKTEEVAKDPESRKILLEFSGVLSIAHKENQVVIEVLRGNKKTRYRLYAKSPEDAQFWSESIEDARSRFVEDDKIASEEKETPEQVAMTKSDTSSTPAALKIEANDSLETEDFCFVDRGSSKVLDSILPLKEPIADNISAENKVESNEEEEEEENTAAELSNFEFLGGRVLSGVVDLASVASTKDKRKEAEKVLEDVLTQVQNMASDSENPVVEQVMKAANTMEDAADELVDAAVQAVKSVAEGDRKSVREAIKSIRSVSSSIRRTSKKMSRKSHKVKKEMTKSTTAASDAVSARTDVSIPPPPPEETISVRSGESIGPPPTEEDETSVRTGASFGPPSDEAEDDEAPAGTPAGLTPAANGGLERKGREANTAVEKMIEQNMLQKNTEVFGLYGKKIPENITKPFLPIEMLEDGDEPAPSKKDKKKAKKAKKEKAKKQVSQEQESPAAVEEGDNQERAATTHAEGSFIAAAIATAEAPAKKPGFMSTMLSKLGFGKKKKAVAQPAASAPISTQKSIESEGAKSKPKEVEEPAVTEKSEDIEVEEDDDDEIASIPEVEAPKPANVRASMAIDIARRSVMIAKMAQQEEKKPAEDEDLSEEERKAKIKERMQRIARGAQGGGQYTTGMALVPFAAQMKESKLAKDLEARRSVLAASQGANMAQQALAAHAAKQAVAAAAAPKES